MKTVRPNSVYQIRYFFENGMRILCTQRQGIGFRVEVVLLDKGRPSKLNHRGIDLFRKRRSQNMLMHFLKTVRVNCRFVECVVFMKMGYRTHNLSEPI